MYFSITKEHSRDDYADVGTLDTTAIERAIRQSIAILTVTHELTLDHTLRSTLNMH
jgi:hypothetical protein